MRIILILLSTFIDVFWLLIILCVIVGILMLNTNKPNHLPEPPTPPQYIILSNKDTAWIKVEKKIVYDTIYQLKKP